MDYDFEPAVKAKIKSVRALAFALGVNDGQDAATARKSADKISREYWREQCRKADDKKHILARTMRRILEKEGAV